MSEKDAKLGGAFYEIGCRQCGKGGRWSIFHDIKGHFKAICNNCSHQTNFEIVDKPDPQAFDLRFFV